MPGPDGQAPVTLLAKFLDSRSEKVLIPDQEKLVNRPNRAVTDRSNKPGSFTTFTI